MKGVSHTEGFQRAAVTAWERRNAAKANKVGTFISLKLQPAPGFVSQQATSSS